MKISKILITEQFPYHGSAPIDGVCTSCEFLDCGTSTASFIVDIETWTCHGSIDVDLLPFPKDRWEAKIANAIKIAKELIESGSKAADLEEQLQDWRNNHLDECAFV